MSAQTGLMTVEEFLKLKDPKEGHYELHHGEVVLVPPPKRGHQRSQWRTRRLLERLAGDRFVVSEEMAFRPTPEHEIWEADVGLIEAERDAKFDDDEYIRGAPDLVVEVLSPSNTVDEINDRMKTCLQNGCSSFWVVDPKNKLLSVTESNVTRHYGPEASFDCAIIGATVPVREIFE